MKWKQRVKPEDVNAYTWAIYSLQSKTNKKKFMVCCSPYRCQKVVFSTWGLKGQTITGI